MTGRDPEYLMEAPTAGEDFSKSAADTLGATHHNQNGLPDNAVRNIGHQAASIVRHVNTALGVAAGSSGNNHIDVNVGVHDQSAGAFALPVTSNERGPVPDRPDARDHQYEYGPEGPSGPYIDFRDQCPPVYNQGVMMSCTAHAVAGEVLKQGLPDFSPSRLFIWYNARAKLADKDAVRKDVGSELRAAIQSLDFKVHGVCAEEDWSYQVHKSDPKTHFFQHNAKPAVKPPSVTYAHAHQDTAAEYKSFKGENLRRMLIKCLESGHPFIFGMKTYNLLSKLVDKDGYGLRPPQQHEMKAGEHRHSLLAVGYIQGTSPSQSFFIIRNSWGTHFGENGYFYMPFTYLKYCYDFWTICLVKSGNH